MIKFSKISTLFISLFVISLSISVLNEHNSAINNFYYFDKPQEDVIETVVDTKILLTRNMFSFFRQSYNKSLQTFDISTVLSTQLLTKLSFSDPINETEINHFISSHFLNTKPKIIVTESDDNTPIFS